MTYHAYVLINTEGLFYKGSTNDLQKRINEHNTGVSKYTKRKGPWKLFYSEVFETRREAVKRELFFKSGKGREFLKSIGH